MHQSLHNLYIYFFEKKTGSIETEFISFSDREHWMAHLMALSLFAMCFFAVTMAVN